MTTHTDTDTDSTPDPEAWHRVSGPDVDMAGWVNPDAAIYNASSLYARGRQRYEIVDDVAPILDEDDEPSGSYVVEEADHYYVVDEHGDNVDDPTETYQYDDGWPLAIDDETKARDIALRLASRDDSEMLAGPEMPTGDVR